MLKLTHNPTRNLRLAQALKNKKIENRKTGGKEEMRKQGMEERSKGGREERRK